MPKQILWPGGSYFERLSLQVQGCRVSGQLAEPRVQVHQEQASRVTSGVSNTGQVVQNRSVKLEKQPQQQIRILPNQTQQSFKIVNAACLISPVLSFIPKVFLNPFPVLCLVLKRKSPTVLHLSSLLKRRSPLSQSSARS